MLVFSKSVARLLGVLGFALLPALGGVVAPVAEAQEPHVSLEARWLLLRKEDVNAQVVQLPDKTTGDARGQLTVRQFDPAWSKMESLTVPNLILDKLWLATDIGTAQQIYQEQVGAGFAEAPGSVACVGGLDLPGYGEESSGIGGRDRCDGSVAHYRVVFRYANAVHVLYLYGPLSYVYPEVAMSFASILNDRIRAVPAGPPPDVMRNVSPRQIALGIDEMGKDADFVGEEEGADDASQWYAARFKRQKERLKSHLGPLEAYSKVWVARDIDTARDIFAEQAQPGMPEATEEVGDGQFPMENLPGWGNDNFGWSACNENCGTSKFLYLHQRYVFRSGNVVAVIYIWGGTQESTANQVSVYAQAMIGRMQ